MRLKIIAFLGRARGALSRSNQKPMRKYREHTPTPSQPKKKQAGKLSASTKQEHRRSEQVQIEEELGEVFVVLPCKPIEYRWMERR